MDIKDNKVIVLFSGGIDSTACIHYYKGLGFYVEGLFINYGQKSFKYEKRAVSKLSKHFGISTKIISVTTKPIVNNGIIQGRNNFLLSIALMNFPFSTGLISLGIHSGTKYPDCSKEFVYMTQEIFNLYSSGNISVDAPFIDMSKGEIFEFCKKHNLPLNLTYSCENGSNLQPCGKCSTCKDLMLLYETKN